MVSLEGRGRGEMEGLEPMFFAQATENWRLDVYVAGLFDNPERSKEVIPQTVFRCLMLRSTVQRQRPEMLA
nr:hypothetical protein [Candidatus Njordarchaeota archaeon]